MFSTTLDFFGCLSPYTVVYFSALRCGVCVLGNSKFPIDKMFIGIRMVFVGPMEVFGENIVCIIPFTLPLVLAFHLVFGKFHI